MKPISWFLKGWKLKIWLAWWYYIKYAPVVKVVTSPTKLEEGDEVTFTCTADTNPGMTVWQFSNDYFFHSGID